MKIKKYVVGRYKRIHLNDRTVAGQETIEYNIYVDKKDYERIKKLAEELGW